MGSRIWSPRMPRAARNVCSVIATMTKLIGTASCCGRKPRVSAAATATEPVIPSAATHTRRPSSCRRRVIALKAGRVRSWRMNRSSLTSTFLQSERDAADAELVAEAEPLGTFDARPIDQRSVRAAEVFDPPFAVAELEHRVTCRRRLVRQRYVVADIAADRRLRAEHEPLADARRASRAALDDERPRRAAAHVDTLRRERAVQRAERAQQEDVEQQQERDAHGPEQRREGDLHAYSDARKTSSRPATEMRSPSFS